MFKLTQMETIKNIFSHLPLVIVLAFKISISEISLYPNTMQWKVIKKGLFIAALESSYIVLSVDFFLETFNVFFNVVNATQ